MELTIDCHPTTRQLAELFCGLGSEQMAEFFAHCKEISDGPDWAAGGVYAQSLWVRDSMKVGTPGADFLMDLAAPWYVHTLQYIDTHGERERA